MSMGIHSTLNLSLDENFTLDSFIKYVATVYHFEVIQFIGCGPLCEKVLRKAISWQPPGE